MTKDRKIYDIDTGYARYWIEVENNKVVKAPPIAKWMIRKHIEQIVGWTAAHAHSMRLVDDQG